MISSSVNGYEAMLRLIEKRIEGHGYDIIMSMNGKIKVNPHLGNYANCLKAVEDCDVFLGIIRTDCGTGRDGESSITFEEFKYARKLGKPRWFIIDSKVKIYKSLLRTLILNEHPTATDMVWLKPSSSVRNSLAMIAHALSWAITSSMEVDLPHYLEMP